MERGVGEKTCVRGRVGLSCVYSSGVSGVCMSYCYSRVSKMLNVMRKTDLNWLPPKHLVYSGHLINPSNSTGHAALFFVTQTHTTRTQEKKVLHVHQEMRSVTGLHENTRLIAADTQTPRQQQTSLAGSGWEAGWMGKTKQREETVRQQ